MNQTNNSNLKWWLLGGAGCLAFLCLCVVAVGAYFLINNSVSLPFAQPTVEVVEPTQEPLAPLSPADEATVPPAPTAASEEPTEPAPAFNGSQWSDDTTLVDDFSTKDMGWVEYDDGSTIIQYADGAYSFKIAEPDYYDWAYVPVDFYPTYIEFDVWGLPGEQNGTVGVMCQIEDEDNHYYVELDLGYREYIVATIINGETTYLTGAGTDDDVWSSTNAIKASPEEVNRVMVVCTPDMISLSVNGEQVYSQFLDEPHLPANEMGIFVFANEDATDGYQVFFDNVTVVK
ncbi:MAG: hypothetical protein JW987_09570 [Anaerolineaceae bacterium]|nr:hypothetical protein [Anaerolineaceae bacterium]